MSKILIVSISLFLSLNLYSQTNLDSLYAVWEDESQTVSKRAEAYNAYVYYGYLFSQPDSAYFLLEQLIDFAKAKEEPAFEALAYNTQGESLYLRGELSNALENYNNAMEIYDSLSNEWGMANSLINIGNIYINQADYSTALEYFEKSLEKYESIDFKNGVANSLSNIGLVYD